MPRQCVSFTCILKTQVQRRSNIVIMFYAENAIRRAFAANLSHKQPNIPKLIIRSKEIRPSYIDTQIFCSVLIFFVSSPHMLKVRNNLGRPCMQIPRIFILHHYQESTHVVSSYSEESIHYIQITNPWAPPFPTLWKKELLFRKNPTGMSGQLSQKQSTTSFQKKSVGSFGYPYSKKFMNFSPSEFSTETFVLQQ